MDEVDLVLAHRQPMSDFEKRQLALQRREFNETRQAERAAEAKRYRDELLFNAYRLHGVEPGSHYNASQRVTEAEAVVEEKRRELDAADRVALEARRQLADLRAAMTEAERMVARQLEAEQQVVVVSPELGRPKGSGAAARSRGPAATCPECRRLTPDISLREQQAICTHREPARQQYELSR